MAESEMRPNWPIVGRGHVRPAGPQDSCLYCQRKIGDQHAYECVMPTKLVEAVFTVSDTAPRPRHGEISSLLGVYTEDLPCSWDEDSCLFHWTGSSWCAGNILNHSDQIRMVEGSLEDLERLAEPNEGCLCEALKFRFSRIVDATPLVRPG